MAVKLGDLDSAFQHYVAGMAEARRLVQSDPGNSDWSRELAGSQEELAGADVYLGRLEPALTGYAEARAIIRHLVKLDPSNSDRREDLAVDDSNIGWVLGEKGRYAEAVASYGEAISIMTQLVASDRGDAGLQQELADMLVNAADSWNRLGNERTASSDARRGQDVLLRLARLAPQDTDLQDDLACGDKTLGDVQVAAGNIDLALQTYRASLAIRQQLDARDSSNLAWRENYAKLLTAMAAAESKQQNEAAARTDAGHATALLDQLIKRSPRHADYRREMSEAQRIGHRTASGQPKSTVTPSAAH
jgi:tetratricopeptide (TPR) repeat protein